MLLSLFSILTRTWLEKMAKLLTTLGSFLDSSFKDIDVGVGGILRMLHMNVVGSF